MVSIKDIAAELGVSTATVSKALNGGRDIGEKTVQLVREKAKEMGYSPNAMARALKTNKTFNIGVLFSDEANSGLKHDFFAAVLDSFKKEVERAGYDITFINASSEGRHGRTLLDHARFRGFDGIMVACTNYENEEVRELALSNIPFVSVDYAYDGCCAVFSDNSDGIHTLVKYAIDGGHKRIAYILGEDSHVTKERLEAYESELKANGIEVNPQYIKRGRYRDTELAAQLTEELLALPQIPDCILYPDDFASLGGVSSILKHGVEIYNNIEVIGYDGILVSKKIPTGITTLVQHSDEIGREAGRLLLRNITEPDFCEKVKIKGHISIKK